MLDGCRAGLILLLLLLPCAAAAQNELRPERLYVSPTATGSSPRLVGLAGAFVGIAERAEGMTSNVAALAQRHPLLYGNWDMEGGVSFISHVGNLGSRDVDHDGVADRAVSSQQMAASFMLQIRRFGIGGYYRAFEQSFCSVEACPKGDYLGIRLANAGVAAAFSFLDDDLIVGAGLYSAQAEFSYHRTRWAYLGNTAEVDLLIRPRGLPFRVGVVYRPEVEAPYQDEEFKGRVVLGRPLHQAVVSPSVLSVGASWRLGEGAHHYNRLSPKARQVIAQRDGEERAPPPVPYDAPTGSLLVSMQADLIFPVRDAISAATFTSLELVPPEPVGNSLVVVPRLGVEHDTLVGRLRTRIGTWFEPSPYRGRKQRPHLTAGADLRLFRLLVDWSLYGAVDLAERSTFFAVGLQGWPGPTPFRKPKEQIQAEEEEEERRQEEAEQRAEEEEERREEEAKRRAEEEEKRRNQAPGAQGERN